MGWHPRPRKYSGTDLNNARRRNYFELKPGTMDIRPIQSVCANLRGKLLVLEGQAGAV